MASNIRLHAAGPEPSDRLRHDLHEARAVRIGRAPQCGVAIAWDPTISREHADLCWREGRLYATCLPSARHPIIYRGQKLRELCVALGESFRIGRTVFQVAEITAGSVRPLAVEPEFGEEAGTDKAFSERDLGRFSFGNTARQMEILAALPRLIAASQTDEDLVRQLSQLLLTALPRAEAVAVARYDVNELPEAGAALDPFPRPKAMSVATREDSAGRFVCSRRLLLSALRQESSAVHIGDGGGSAGATMSEGLGWAFCCPIRGELCRGWCLYVSGKGPADGSLAPPENDLLGDLRFAELVAQFIGAVRQDRLRQEHLTVIQNDLRVGRQLQENFLPASLPQPDGWEVAARFHPAREVGGDFYDVFRLSDDHLGLAIADVCSKGVGAALFMAMFRSLLREGAQQTLARQLAHHLTGAAGTGGEADAETMRRLMNLLIEFNVLSTVLFANNYLAETHGASAMFVTTFFAVLDVTSGTLYYVNGGHEAPVVVGPQGVKCRLELTGPVVGMAPNTSYATQKVTLEPGDVLFCYTDGVTEAHVTPGGAMFGEPRLLALLGEPGPSAAALAERVDAAVAAHYAGAEPYDDITLLCVRRAPAPGGPMVSGAR
jgi:serine phosphatase RsbU (regulator of sigma subunit)